MELDVVSYGRRGTGRPGQFTPEQIAQISRTIRRTPEVMVKVSGGGNTLGAVAAHFRYISRGSQLEIETDDGERLQGKDAAKEMMEDWDLDLDAIIDRRNYAERGGRAAQPKLVHNIVLSMPAGTSPERLMAASRSFAREEFAAQHRYAMALHTDQDHPHMHLVVSAHRLDGGRLNIRKADLRRYRELFARQLRAQGIEANATPAQVRGRLSNYKRDGVYRAGLRGESHVELQQARQKAQAVFEGRAARDTTRIFDTALAVQDDWRKTSDALARQGMGGLATEVDRFLQSLSAPRTRQDRAIQAVRQFQLRRDQRKQELAR
ncbi:MAG: relaxase/mobilization nuclease domain-containing protein [Pseudomonadota bacterium]